MRTKPVQFPQAAERIQENALTALSQAPDFKTNEGFFESQQIRHLLYS
jgi:hypothetical protein